MLAVPPDEGVDLRDLDLEQFLEGPLDLGPRRPADHEELETIPVLQVLSGRALEHVERLLGDVGMDEDLMRFHGCQLRNTSRAPSLNTASRPGSPPGASTSAFRPAGLTTSTPGRFPNNRRTFFGSFTTTSRLRGWRYLRPRILPRPARTWRPPFARSTSESTPRRSRILTPSRVAPPSGSRVSSPSSTITGRLSASLKWWPRAATISDSLSADRAAFRAIRRSFSLIFLAHTLSGRGGCARRPPTVPGACAPVIEPRSRGTRDTPCPLPDQRTEWRIPDRNAGPYGWRRFACAAVTARRMRSNRTSPWKIGGRSTDLTTSPSRE